MKSSPARHARETGLRGLLTRWRRRRTRIRMERHGHIDTSVRKVLGPFEEVKWR